MAGYPTFFLISGRIPDPATQISGASYLNILQHGHLGLVAVGHGDPLGDVQHDGDGLVRQHDHRQVTQRLGSRQDSRL